MLVIVAFLTLILMDTSCGINNAPPPTKKTGKYLLYVGAWSSNKIFIVDPSRSDSIAVVDSLTGFADSLETDMTLTRSGAKLYITTRTEYAPNFPGHLYSVDLATKQIESVLDVSADAYVAPSGQVFVVAFPKNATPKIGTVDTLTDQVSFFDTLDIQPVAYNHGRIAFSPTSPVLYAVNKDAHLFEYNYQQKKVVRTYKNAYSILYMLISKDGKTLYGLAYDYTFLVFDLKNDRIIKALSASHLATIAFSPDKKKIYLTDPADGYPGNVGQIYPSAAIRVFNTLNNSFEEEISVIPITGQPYTLTDGITLTPDGKFAYVTGITGGFTGIIMLDLQTGKAIRGIFPLGHSIPTQILLGPKLPNGHD